VNEMNQKLTWTMTALDRQLLGGREYANTRFGSEEDNMGLTLSLSFDVAARVASGLPRHVSKYTHSFSNHGSCTDIWAPGSAITSAGVRDDTGSATFSGTSMACPHVSGGAALVLGLSPTKSPADVLADLVDRAEKGAISDLKNGDVNVFLWVGSGPAPVPSPMA